LVPERYDIPLGFLDGKPVNVGISRRSTELLADVFTAGITPVECMLTILRDETADPKDRAWAAEKAAPFIHPRPAPLDRAIEIELPDTSTIEGVDGALDCLIQAAAKGEISPAEGQSMIAVIEARRRAIETGDMLERIKKLEEALAVK
jgi:hypothetical protein